jgi:hypothetical protein
MRREEKESGHFAQDDSLGDVGLVGGETSKRGFTTENTESTEEERPTPFLRQGKQKAGPANKQELLGQDGVDLG